MTKKTLKQKVREVIVMRNTLDKVIAVLPKTRYGKKLANDMAVELMYTARYAHKDMPYYIVTRTI